MFPIHPELTCITFLFVSREKFELLGFLSSHISPACRSLLSAGGFPVLFLSLSYSHPRAEHTKLLCPVLWNFLRASFLCLGLFVFFLLPTWLWGLFSWFRTRALSCWVRLAALILRHIRQLTTICNFGSSVSNNLFWPLLEAAHMQHTHIEIIL